MSQLQPVRMLQCEAKGTFLLALVILDTPIFRVFPLMLIALHLGV